MITKRISIDKETGKRILSALREVVGPERATDNPAVNFSYSGSGMPFPKAMPDFVVRPKTTQEVQRIVKIALKFQVPLTPVASGTQEPGTNPWFGGIVVDTMSMDVIHEIDDVGGYAVIEPGVTMGRLSHELAKRNLRLTMGSFPPGISCLGNYLMTAVNSHRTLGPPDDLMGLEVVMADGSVLNTGSKAFSHGYSNASWFLQSNSFPNIKNLFIDHAGTLGIVTRGAVRIYELGEARTMPISAFDDYASAVKYMVKVGRGNLVQHICSWHWVLLSIIDHLGVYGRGAPTDVITTPPWESPEDRPYIVTVPSISGFKEQTEGARRDAERVTKELGGRVFTDECKEKWPGAYKFFKDHYFDHIPSNQFQGAYGEAIPMMSIVFSDPRNIVELEKWGLRFLRESGLQLGLTYYSHANDQSRSMFLRMTPFIQRDLSEDEKKTLASVRREYMEKAFDRYGAVPVRHDYGLSPGETLSKTGAHGKALIRIKKALDPDNIMNPGMSYAIYGDLSKDTDDKGGA